jgi:hypoxanthine phosphoribosyltransferase
MLTYTWDTFRHDCKILADRVSEYNCTDLVIIERGGLYVAQELIPLLPSKPTVHSVRVSFYSGQIRNQTPVVRWTNKRFNPTSRILIVDDLIDSGTTIDFLKNYEPLQNVEALKFAVLAVKDVSPFKSDYYVLDNVTGWVVFPWEDAKGDHIDPVSHTAKAAASA